MSATIEFRLVEPIELESVPNWMASIRVGLNPSVIFVGDMVLEVSEARRLRDWLNSALPADAGAKAPTP